MADDEDVLKELRLAALLARTPDWHGDPPPDAAQLMAMLTINGAVAAQIAPDVGTVAAGKKADLVAIDLEHVRRPYLDADMPIADAFLARATARDVRMTMVEGRIVFREGKLQKLDRSAIEQEAADAASTARLPRDIANRDRARALRGHLLAHYAGRS